MCSEPDALHCFFNRLECQSTRAAKRLRGLVITTRVAAKQNRPILGALWMLGTVVSFALMQISGRELSSEHDVVAVMLYRSLVGLILVLPIALVFDGAQVLTTSRPFSHLLRNGVHFLGQMSWFYGIAHLALADVSALNAMVPIFGIVLAIVFMRETLSRPRLFAILCGFFGVLIVVRPGFVALEAATYVTLVGALFYAVSIVMMKALTRSEPALRIVLYMMAIQFCIALVLAGGYIAMPSLAEAPWVVIVGASGLTAHYCMARAVAIADASVILPISYLQLPVMAIVGLAFYGEQLDFFTLGGGFLIFAATYLNVLWSRPPVDVRA